MPINYFNNVTMVICCKSTSRRKKSRWTAAFGAKPGLAPGGLLTSGGN
jgi:hypothetical protein